MTTFNPFASTANVSAKVVAPTRSGSLFDVPESGAYPATCKMAYLVPNAYKPQNTNCVFILNFDAPSKYEWKYTIPNVLIDGKATTDKGEVLNGFAAANILIAVFSGMILEQAGTTLKSKKVKIWKSKAEGEVTTDVQAFDCMVGKKGIVGLVRKVSNKRENIGTASDPDWIDTPDKVTTAVMQNSANTARMTYTELLEGADTATELDKWEKSNKGRDWNAFTKVAGATGGKKASKAGGFAKKPAAKAGIQFTAGVGTGVAVSAE